MCRLGQDKKAILMLKGYPAQQIEEDVFGILLENNLDNQRALKYNDVKML